MCDDYVYRVAPPNSLLSLKYQRQRWGASLTARWFDDQSRVSAVNGESASDSYHIFDLRGFVQLTGRLKLGFGIENIADEHYA